MKLSFVGRPPRHKSAFSGFIFARCLRFEVGVSTLNPTLSYHNQFLQVVVLNPHNYEIDTNPEQK